MIVKREATGQSPRGPFEWDGLKGKECGPANAADAVSKERPWATFKTTEEPEPSLAPEWNGTGIGSPAW